MTENSQSVVSSRLMIAERIRKKKAFLGKISWKKKHHKGPFVFPFDYVCIHRLHLDQDEIRMLAFHRRCRYFRAVPQAQGMLICFSVVEEIGDVEHKQAVFLDHGDVRKRRIGDVVLRGKRLRVPQQNGDNYSNGGHCSKVEKKYPFV